MPFASVPKEHLSTTFRNLVWVSFRALRDHRSKQNFDSV